MRSVGEGFEFLVRERTGLPYSCTEIRATGERLVAQMNEQLAQEVRKFGKKKAFCGAGGGGARGGSRSGEPAGGIPACE